MRFAINKVMLIIALSLVISTVGVYGDSTGNQYVKVGLKYGSAASVSCTLICDSGFSIGAGDKGSYTESLPLPAYKTLTVAMENGTVAVRAEDGTLISSDMGEKGCIMPLHTGGDSNMSIDGKPYRGGAYFLGNPNNTINVINYISLDDYVKGVLNAEMNHDNPLEALKAQAVAARSFGFSNLSKHAASGFDFCTGTHCQVYKGYSDEYVETNKAVDETAGLTLYHKGEPVAGYYFKNSGGYTQSAADVWGGKQGYLMAVKDEYSPLYPWIATYTFDQLAAQLTAAGRSVGMLQSVAVTERSDSGGVKTVAFTGSSGVVTLEKEEMRTIFGYGVIKSMRFSITGDYNGDTSGGSRDSDKNALTSLWISNGGLAEKATRKLSLMSGSGEIVSMDTSSTHITDGKVKLKINDSINQNPQAPISGTGAEVVTKSPITFSGMGYGHGIGMPQDSAVSMAKQGFTFMDILKYYYTDIQIQ